MNTELKDIDIDDIDDLLIKIEDSFNIKFVDNELTDVTTFGELCDCIANKIQLEKSEDCTYQMAFYKLRDAISATFSIDKKTISPDFLLSEFLPRKNRRKNIQKLEEKLGLKINTLSPKLWTAIVCIILFLASIVLGGIFGWKVLFGGFVISIFCLWIAFKTGKELNIKTVGELAKKMARENYLKSRRNPNTFNKNEIEKILTDWFSNDAYIEKSKLTRDAIFNK